MASQLLPLGCGSARTFADCTRDEQCPSGYRCQVENGRCEPTDAVPGTDAGVVDAAALDAAVMDRPTAQDSARSGDAGRAVDSSDPADVLATADSAAAGDVAGADGPSPDQDAAGPSIDAALVTDAALNDGAGQPVDAALTDHDPAGDAEISADSAGASDLGTGSGSPPPLDDFHAGLGVELGAIELELDYPLDVSDYQRVELLRVAGDHAPPASCDAGDLAFLFGTGAFLDVVLQDSGLVELGIYSYRVCIYDVDGNLTSSNVVENVQTKGCWVAVSGTSTHTNRKAAIADRWFWDHRPGSTEAWAPQQILVGLGLTPGAQLRMTHDAGNSICRIYNNAVECLRACPGGWLLHFRDQNGAIIVDGTTPVDLVFYREAVAVPVGAVDAWIGYRDGACGSAGTCTSSGYFDNEGNRSTSSGQSTGGCDFNFLIEEYACN